MSKPQCDLVMKGGITSGVVYPRAIHELSKAYRFKNIAGTSVGAIAAVMAAAAQYGENEHQDGALIRVSRENAAGARWTGR
jgi:predicted acylesterase/phospholipase RssA